MNAGTWSALIIAGTAVLGAIGSVLLLAFRVGSLVGTNTAFMASAERESERFRADITRLSDRMSLHIEHHGAPSP